MIEVSKILLEFIIVFLMVYFSYYLFYFKRLKKYNRNKPPINIKYLLIRYKIDVIKIGYKRLVKALMLCDSFIIAFLFSITRFISNLYVRLLVAFILVFPLFAGVYHLVAMYYKKESE